ncbi:hypothetical protein K3495_g1377 [Podosphaera aphanis]|nr:hypothetical protein K3495_g1377 [Podosphaera aphanis]
MIDDRQATIDEQVAEFNYRLMERFPAKWANHTEGNLQNDIKNFTPKEAEPLTGTVSAHYIYFDGRTAETPQETYPLVDLWF